MTKRSTLALVSAAALLFLSGAASAQTHNIKSTLVISDRVEVPGAILEPGTYLVRVAEQQADRNTVVFQSLDGTKTFATAIATPHPQKRSIDETEFVYFPTASGETRVLRTWFPPNDRFAGQDFTYAADRMAALRSGVTTKAPVTTTAMTTETTRTSTETEASTRQPEMVPATPPPPPAPEPVTRTADIGTRNEMNTPSNEMNTRSSDMTANDRSATLPHTASPLPAVGSLGLMFLAAGTLLRRRRV